MKRSGRACPSPGALGRRPQIGSVRENSVIAVSACSGDFNVTCACPPGIRGFPPYVGQQRGFVLNGTVSRADPGTATRGTYRDQA